MLIATNSCYFKRDIFQRVENVSPVSSSSSFYWREMHKITQYRVSPIVAIYCYSVPCHCFLANCSKILAEMSNKTLCYGNIHHLDKHIPNINTNIHTHLNEISKQKYPIDILKKKHYKSILEASEIYWNLDWKENSWKLPKLLKP